MCVWLVYAKTSSILDDDDEDVTPIIIPTTSSKHKPPPTSSASQPSTSTDTSAIDITADDILPRLTPPNVTDLVLLSMVRHCNYIYLISPNLQE